MPMYTPFAGGNTAKPITDCLDSMKTVATGITAGSDTTQANATNVTKSMNVVATVAAAGRGIRLPVTSAATVGQTVFLFNGGANSMQVFGGGTDTINAVATATGVAHAAGVGKLYICTAAGAWHVAG